VGEGGIANAMLSTQIAKCQQHVGSMIADSIMTLQQIPIHCVRNCLLSSSISCRHSVKAKMQQKLSMAYHHVVSVKILSGVCYILLIKIY